MTTTIRLVVKRDRTKEFADKLTQLAAIGIDRGCAVIEQAAKADAPRKTGALRASAYRITKLHNGYQAGVAAMTRHNPKAQATYPGLVAAGRKTFGIVGFAANHAKYVHDGTHKMSGRPWLVNAFEANKHRVVEEIRDAIKSGLR